MWESSYASARSSAGENAKGRNWPHDITARKYFDKSKLSFSMPFQWFLEMEANVDESFLTKGKDWPKLAERL